MNLHHELFRSMTGAPRPDLGEEAAALRLVDEAVAAPREPVVVLLDSDEVTPLAPPIEDPARSVPAPRNVGIELP